jgi:hypothetical protein
MIGVEPGVEPNAWRATRVVGVQVEMTASRFIAASSRA